MSQEFTKISAATVLGAGVPSLNWTSIFDSLDPVLKSLLLLMQIAVAIVSFLYILKRCRSISNSPRRRGKKIRK